MSIIVQCTACGKRFKVEDKFAGKRGKCRSCGALVVVPAATAGDDPLADLSAIEPVADTPHAPRPLPPQVSPSSSDGPGLRTWIAIGAGGLVLLVVMILLVVKLLRPAPPVVVEAGPASARIASPGELTAAVAVLKRPPPPAGATWDVDVDRPAAPAVDLLPQRALVRLPTWPATGVLNGYGFRRAGLRGPIGVFGSALRADSLRGDGVLQIWDLVSGRQLLHFRGETDLGRPVFSPEGAMVAGSIVENGFTTGVRVVSLRDGRSMWEFRGDARNAVGFLSPSRLLTLGGGDLVAWDLTLGKSIAKIPAAGAGEGALGLSPNGHLAAGIVKDELVMIDLAAGKVAGRARVPEGLLSHVGASLHATPPVFSPDGSLLAVAFSLASAGINRVAVWDVAYGRPQWNVDVPKDAAADLVGAEPQLAWRPDGRAILRSGRIFSYPEGQLICRAVAPFPADKPAIIGFADNEHVLLQHGDHPEGIVLERARIDIAHQRLVAADRPAAAKPVVIQAEGMREAFKTSPNHITSVLFLPDAKTIVTGDANGVVTLWDRATWKARAELKTKESFGNRPEAIAASKDGKLAVAEVSAARIHLWDAATGSSTGMLLGRAGPDLAFTPDGSGLLFYEVTFGETSLVHVAGGQHRLRLAGPPQTRLAISPDGRTIAQARDNLELLDSATGEVLKRLGAGKGINHLVFSPDGGRLLATHGTESATPGVECFDLHSFDRVWSQQRPGGAEWISFAPDGRLAAVSFMVSLVLMNPANGDHMGGFNRLGSGQKSSFAPDGRQLAVVADGIVRVFDVETILAGRAETGINKR